MQCATRHIYLINEEYYRRMRLSYFDTPLWKVSQAGFGRPLPHLDYAAGRIGGMEG